MRITRIEPQSKNPHRRNVYADGEFIVGISDETLLRSGLRTGDEINDEQVKALVREEELAGARKLALRFLAHRPRTAMEVRDRLRAEDFGDGDIEKVIGDLKKVELVNDAGFARMYISDALSTKATGKTLLRRKLLLLGVEKGLVDEALQKAFASVDEAAEALTAGRKFLKKSAAAHTPANAPRLRQRLAAFLGRRGFTWETVESVIKALMKEQEE